LSKKYKSGVYAHSSETESEVKECVERHGKTPTALFNDLGLLDNGGGYFHLTHLTNEDITLLAKNKIYSVTNPCSNLKLASGIAELEKQYKAGIKIAIGTDGAASNNALDMFRETYLAAVLAKVKTNDAAAAPADIVLNWAVGNGADAMGLPDSNALEVGKKADFVIIDLAAPNMNPHNNLIKNLVYSGNPSNVLATIIDGKTVYENGEWKTLNVAELNAEANKIIARMKA
jgi:5-methylthioadenosine/S-adenosylhomocysteine deaminase